MSRYTKKYHEKKRKNNISRKSRGGGMFQSAAMWHVRNYVDVLEKRLVTQYNDYDWVQKQRVDYYFLKKDKSKY
jgi:hypothetical protein|tara:strand:+ start:979 stop:1200 length:222 start_codon:yes stop_codon:yes gene_type:complete